MADKGDKGAAGLSKAQTMPSNMESPLNAQKNGPEPGPSAPSGLPNWAEKDPMGYLSGQGEPGKKGK